jgi:midasin
MSVEAAPVCTVVAFSKGCLPDSAHFPLLSAAAAAAAASLQIWVPAITDEAELLAILESRLAASAARTTISRHLLQFWHLFVSQAPTAARGGLSVRDLLAWVGFVNATSQQLGALQAYAHGAYLTLLDGLGLGLGIPVALLAPLRQKCRRLLEQQLAGNVDVTAGDVINSVSNSAEGQQLLSVTVGEAAAVVGQAAGELQLQPNTPVDVTTDDGRWGIPPFFVARGPAEESAAAAGSSSSSGSGPRFNWQAPTTCRNAFRLLRAMQVGCMYSGARLEAMCLLCGTVVFGCFVFWLC